MKNRIRLCVFNCFLLAQVAVAQSPSSTGAVNQEVPDENLLIDAASAGYLGVEYRTFDGTNNNLNNPLLGSTGIDLLRLSESNYGDGISSLAGEDLASPRAISNAVLDDDEHKENTLRASSFLWQWGQFVDHDLDLTPLAEPLELEPIAIPAGDIFFDPQGTGTQTITFDRSIFNTDTGISSPREQINIISAWLDGSNVYGSSEERALALRTLDGTGKLKTSAGNLLPFNEEGIENDAGPNPAADPTEFFIAGDIRANEQLGLTAMHTLFVREHNRIAQQLNKFGITGDEAYQKARQLVVAYLQVITYKEFLPALLGKKNGLAPYSGYKENVSPNISNEFSTAAFRVGHSMLNSVLLRLDKKGNEIDEGHVSLRDSFFSPDKVIEEGGIEPIIRGLAAQTALDVDVAIVDDVRNFLFGPPGAGGFDLASLNIQRGRDHGLPGYNDVREAVGLPRIKSFRKLNVSKDVRKSLQSVYADVDSIDPWVGGLAENHLKGGLVGELFNAVIKDQFTRLRDADRFWYQSVFHGKALRNIEKTRLSDVILRNTTIKNREIRNDVFKVAN